MNFIGLEIASQPKFDSSSAVSHPNGHLSQQLSTKNADLIFPPKSPSIQNLNDTQCMSAANFKSILNGFPLWTNSEAHVEAL